jgi:predicted aspartyl protease
MRTAAIIAMTIALLAAGGASAAGASPRSQELVIGLNVVKRGKAVLALVPVTIDGKGPFTFALDTGASRSLIDSAAAKRLAAPKKGTAGKIAGVNAVTKATLVKINDWRVGQVKLPPTMLVTTNLPLGNAYAGIQGLLGSDMLSGFDVITIDYAKQQLRLHARK